MSTIATGREIARQAGISEVRLSRIRHKKHEPKVGTALRIADASGATVEELFGFWKESPDHSQDRGLTTQEEDDHVSR